MHPGRRSDCPVEHAGVSSLVGDGVKRRGEALIELGQWEEGTAQLQQGREAYQATGALLGTRGCSVAELAGGTGAKDR